MEDPLWELTDISRHGEFSRLLSIITGETIAKLVTTVQAPAIIHPQLQVGLSVLNFPVLILPIHTTLPDKLFYLIAIQQIIRTYDRKKEVITKMITKMISGDIPFCHFDRLP